MALQVNALGFVAWRIPEISSGKEPFDGCPILIVTMTCGGFQANCHTYHFIRISYHYLSRHVLIGIENYKKGKTLGMNLWNWAGLRLQKPVVVEFGCITMHSCITKFVRYDYKT